MIGDAVGGKLGGQFFAKQFIDVQVTVHVGVHPQQSVPLDSGELEQPVARLVDSAEVIFIGDVQKIAGIGIAPRVERAHEYRLLAALF